MMIFPEISLDVPRAAMVMVALVLFGIAYNAKMDELGERKEGYVAILVAIGVTITLVLAAVIYWPAAVLMFACFVASGIPMIAGDIARYIDKRERDKAKDRMRHD